MMEINKVGTTLNKHNYSSLYTKLIALWVVCEAMIGGIIHGLKLPFSGLIVGGAAVVCITMIGHYVPAKGAILKATIIVAVFKMMLSPQAPATAYIAVFFQGFMGQLLFTGKNFLRIRAISLGVLALAESAVQRILVLTLLYGTTFWKAVNEFMAKVLHQRAVTNYTLVVAAVYVFIHVIIGALLGNYCYSLIRRAGNEQNENIPVNNCFIQDTVFTQKRKNKYRPALLVVYCIMLIMYLQSLFRIGNPILPKGEVAQVLVRSGLILLSWYFVVAPVLLKWIRAILEKKRTAFAKEINDVMEVLPGIRDIVVNSWNQTSETKGFKRVGMWSKRVVITTLRS